MRADLRKADSLLSTLELGKIPAAWPSTTANTTYCCVEECCWIKCVWNKKRRQFTLVKKISFISEIALEITWILQEFWPFLLQNENNAVTRNPLWPPLPPCPSDFHSRSSGDVQRVSCRGWVNCSIEKGTSSRIWQTSLHFRLYPILYSLEQMTFLSRWLSDSLGFILSQWYVYLFLVFNRNPAEYNNFMRFGTPRPDRDSYQLMIFWTIQDVVDPLNNQHFGSGLIPLINNGNHKDPVLSSQNVYYEEAQPWHHLNFSTPKGQPNNSKGPSGISDLLWRSRS